MEGFMRLLSATFVVLLAAGLAAQSPADGDRVYQAIRQDDLTTLRELVKKDVNGKDAQGQTALMLAAAFGSVEAVRTLIALGADARAAGNGGLTPLHLAADNATKTRLLLEAGADVNVASALGRTPLIAAASVNAGADVVRLLLDKGADIHAADSVGVTPLIGAANVDNRAAADLLLARGADPHAQARTGQPSNALMGAAVNGNLPLVRALLARKVDVAAVSADRTGTVKNGPVRYGTVTALHVAVTGGNADVVEVLLKSGAPVNAADVRGMTPLMWAVATDRPDARLVRLLLAHGAEPSFRSLAGETAVGWARKFNNPLILSTLSAPHDAPAGLTATPAASHRAASARDAVARSLPLQRAASARVMTDGGCAACHAAPLTALAIDAARARGWTTLSSEAESSMTPTLLNAFATNLAQLPDQGGAPDALVYPGVLMAAQKAPATRATDVLVRYLAAKQRPGGNWRGVGATRAPMQDGDFSRTAMSLRTLAHFATPARRAEYRDRVARAAGWLAVQTPLTTEDRVMQILGLHWAGAHASTRERRVRELLQLQRADGGWAQTPHLTSDAYATGQVLYTLSELGVPAPDAARQRASAFLVATQREDGSWHVRTRAMAIQPYFESGFPYGHDQWISHAATAWATIGLASAAP
jgi:ankyrin repeat protein